MTTTVCIEHGKPPSRLDVVMAFQAENRFLSNFWPCDVTLPAEIVDGIEMPEMQFQSTENAYQAWKCSCLQQRQQMQTMTSGEAKKLSMSENFLKRHEATPESKLSIMEKLLRQKFSDKNPELKKSLLDTKNMLLIEGNNWGDMFWGVCLDSGQGQNNLGRLVMKIRSELKS